MMMMNIMQFPV